MGECDDTGEGDAEKSHVDPTLPKRIIQLGEDVKMAWLVPSPTNLTVSYAALSYCWGLGNATFKTEGHTLEDFELDIPCVSTSPDYK